MSEYGNDTLMHKLILYPLFGPFGINHGQTAPMNPQIDVMTIKATGWVLKPFKPGIIGTAVILLSCYVFEITLLQCRVNII